MYYKGKYYRSMTENIERNIRGREIEKELEPLRFQLEDLFMANNNHMIKVTTDRLYKIWYSRLGIYTKTGIYSIDRKNKKKVKEKMYSKVWFDFDIYYSLNGIDLSKPRANQEYLNKKEIEYIMRGLDFAKNPVDVKILKDRLNYLREREGK